MNSVRCLSLMRHTALLGAAIAFALGTASAQAISAADDSAAYSSSNAVSPTESRSTSLPDDVRIADLALPASAAPARSGGGQYDNRSRGAGMGGMRSHLTYEVGGGFNAPTEESAQHVSWGGNVTVGAGYRFNQNASLMVEYQFIDSKLPGLIIDEAGATGGHVHIWSLTLDPVIDMTPRSAVDLYLVGGGGFYRSVTSFTDPQQQQYCTYFYCGVVTQNVVVGHYSSNQGGWNGGLGIAHRFAGWNGDGKMKVFAEARYLAVMTPAITTQANGLGTTSVDADTRIIPVTVGFRW
jgi:hypothetical protein